MINVTKSAMRTELVTWLKANGLPTTTLQGPVTAEFLLRSPDSLTPTQRAWLRSFREDYSDAAGE